MHVVTLMTNPIPPRTIGLPQRTAPVLATSADGGVNKMIHNNRVSKRNDHNNSGGSNSGTILNSETRSPRTPIPACNLRRKARLRIPPD